MASREEGCAMSFERETPWDCSESNRMAATARHSRTPTDDARLESCRRAHLDYTRWADRLVVPTDSRTSAEDVNCY